MRTKYFFGSLSRSVTAACCTVVLSTACIAAPDLDELGNFSAHLELVEVSPKQTWPRGWIMFGPENDALLTMSIDEEVTPFLFTPPRTIGNPASFVGLGVGSGTGTAVMINNNVLASRLRETLGTRVGFVLAGSTRWTTVPSFLFADRNVLARGVITAQGDRALVMTTTPPGVALFSLENAPDEVPLLSFFNIPEMAEVQAARAYTSGGIYVGGVWTGGTWHVVAVSTGRLWVLQVENNSDVSLVGQVELAASTENPDEEVTLHGDVIVKGDYAYVTDQGSSLYAVNLIDPSYPQLTHTACCMAKGLGMTLVGENFLAVANGEQGATLVDLSTPEEPILLNTTNAGEMNYLAAQDNYVFGSGGRNIIIMKVFEDDE